MATMVENMESDLVENMESDLSGGQWLEEGTPQIGLIILVATDF